MHSNILVCSSFIKVQFALHLAFTNKNRNQTIKMKKILYSFFTLIVNIIVAQPIVQEFAAFNNDKSYRFNAFIDADETGFYFSTVHKTERPFIYFLEKRNKGNGELIFEIKLDHKPYYTICNNNKIVIIYSELGKNSVRNLSCSIFSSTDGSKIKDKELEEIGGQKLGPYTYDYSIITTPDKTKLLIIPNQNSNDIPNNKLENKFPKMYNSNTMEVIWELQSNMSLEEDAVIDNNGNILLPLANSIGIIKFKSDKVRYLSESLTSPQWMRTLLLDFTKDGQAIACGIFIGGKAGFYYSKINVNEFKFENEQIQYFTPEVEQKLTWQDNVGFVNKNPSDKDYKALKLIEQNGIIYFIAEHCLHTVRMGDHPDVAHPSNLHKELIISKFSTSGKIEWVKILPRSTGMITGNLHFGYYNNKLNLIYLDDKSNTKKYSLDSYEPEKLKIVSNIYAANALCITIDEKGVATRKVLYFTYKFVLYPQDKNVLLDSKTLLIFMRHKESDKLGTITFD